MSSKVIATLGPAVNTYQSIEDLLSAGANGFNIQIWPDLDYLEQQIAWVRKASRELNQPAAIILALRGPYLALGNFEGVIAVKKGRELALRYGANYRDGGQLPIGFDFGPMVKRGETVLFNSGALKATITAARGGVVHLRADNNGTLVSGSPIYLPDSELGSSIFTDDDRQIVNLAHRHKIEYVSIGNIQAASDLFPLRRQLRTTGSHTKVIAKLETKQALAQLDKILLEADGVLLDRENLTIALAAEKLPAIQKHVIKQAVKAARPVIISGGILPGMVDRPKPAVAEIASASAAVNDGADSIMLSDETIFGSYPAKAVEKLKAIIRHNMQPKSPAAAAATRQSAVSRAIADLSEGSGARAIVVDASSAASAMQLAAMCLPLPVIAVTDKPMVANQLELAYGVLSFVRPASQNNQASITLWLRQNKVLNKGDLVIICSGRQPGAVGSTDTIEIRAVE